MTTTTEARPTRQEQCPKHGAFTSTNFYRDHWSICEACAAEARREEKEAERHGRIQDLIAYANIPPKFARADLSGAPPKVLAWLKAAATGMPTGPLVITGPVGVGKSFTACGALRHFIAQTLRQGRYTTASSYGAAVRGT